MNVNQNSIAFPKSESESSNHKCPGRLYRFPFQIFPPWHWIMMGASIFRAASMQALMDEDETQFTAGMAQPRLGPGKIFTMKCWENGEENGEMMVINGEIMGSYDVDFSSSWGLSKGKLTEKSGSHNNTCVQMFLQTGPYDKLTFKNHGRKRIDETAKHGDSAAK